MFKFPDTNLNIETGKIEDGGVRVYIKESIKEHKVWKDINRLGVDIEHLWIEVRIRTEIIDIYLAQYTNQTQILLQKKHDCKCLKPSCRT